MATDFFCDREKHTLWKYRQGYDREVSITQSQAEEDANFQDSRKFLLFVRGKVINRLMLLSVYRVDSFITTKLLQCSLILTAMV